MNQAQHGIAGETGLFGDFTRGVTFDSIEVEGFALLGRPASNTSRSSQLGADSEEVGSGLSSSGPKVTIFPRLH